MSGVRLNTSALEFTAPWQETIMDETPTSRQTERQKLRESLTDDILFIIEQEIKDAIPNDILEGGRKELLDDSLASSRHVLASLSIEQLQNPGLAMERHIESTVASVKYLVRRIREQQRRA
jgi:hypothetical protein